MDAQRDFLDVENNIRHILANAGDGGKLMQDAIDMDACDGSALERRQQDTAQSITERQAKTALKWLRYNRTQTLWVPPLRHIELGGLDQILPVLLQHREPRSYKLSASAG
jgi:hypothetical protein